MGSIGNNLQEVKRRIAAASAGAGRPANCVTLLAVSKTFPPDAVRQAHALGQRAFGENYVQEALDKIDALGDLRPGIEWHLIGPLQSNKTRAVAAAFDWVHSVDRLKIAERLAEQRPPELPPLNLCLQVNISREARKSGVLPQDALALARAVAALPRERVRLRGLMAIPAPVAVGPADMAAGQTGEAAALMAAQREPHRALCELLTALNAQGVGQSHGQGHEQGHGQSHEQGHGHGHDWHLDTLSMGMSADLEAAICEGASIVRVGAAIFGARS